MTDKQKLESLEKDIRELSVTIKYLSVAIDNLKIRIGKIEPKHMEWKTAQEIERGW